MLVHQFLRFAQRCIRPYGDRVDDHPAFKPLDLTDREALFFNTEIPMQHANTAQLSHNNSHVRFSHGIHGRTEDRDVQVNLARQPGACISHAGQDIAFGRT